MVTCIFLLFLSNQVCFILLEVPRVRLFEQVICQQYYRQHPRPNADGQSDNNERSGLDCSIPVIQSELAAVIGIKTAMDAVPGLLPHHLPFHVINCLS